MINQRLAEALVALLFVATIAVVFQQIATDMTEQGIASGGPYSNAASYPRALAIVILVALLLSIGIRSFQAWRGGTPEVSSVPIARLVRPAALLILFALYLWGLDVVGYLVASIILMALVLVLCGERSALRLTIIPVFVTFALSAVFGGMLDVVLPRGAFGLAMPW
ncbi:tripartite tricarboxylate transporter TctB family protein [uncultured Jannaschia sp.]|uniref:tripartite tricarboxylate transporter TctB family protein n=1 Tax=uncultured Jannaschia sp. TaxID=293347 RepID=UPI00262CA62E|nr:tripartite tricarboxylate transporter TctB family protein [uncultured Jannaschia sp.]